VANNDVIIVDATLVQTRDADENDGGGEGDGDGGTRRRALASLGLQARVREGEVREELQRARHLV